MEEVVAFSTESRDGVKVENGDKIKPEIKSGVKSEEKLAVKDEHVDATKHNLAFRIVSALANLHGIVGLNVYHLGKSCNSIVI